MEKILLNAKIMAGAIEEIEIVLKNCTNIKKLEVDPLNPPLLIAATANQHKIVKLLLDYGFNPNIQAADGMTALMSSTWNQQVDTVDILLQYGANPNIIDKDKWSALFYAATRGNERLVDLLLQYGADPKLKDCYRKTPAVKARENNFLRLSRHLNYAVKLNPIKNAEKMLINQEYDELEDWIISGAPLNAGNHDGDSLLHLACKRQDLHGIELILSFHPNIKRMNYKGKTAIDYIPSEFKDIHELFEQDTKGSASYEKTEWHDWFIQLYDACHIEVSTLLEMAIGANLTQDLNETQAYEELDKCGNEKAISLALALHYFKVRQFPNIYERFLEQQLTEPLARYIQACIIYDQGRRDNSILLFKELIKEEFSPAMVTYGGILMIDLLNSKSKSSSLKKEIFQLYLKGAELGNRKAMFEVATLYYSGTGTQKDMDQAIKWFNKASLQGIYNPEFNQLIMDYMLKTRIPGGHLDFNHKLEKESNKENLNIEITDAEICECLEEILKIIRSKKLNLSLLLKQAKTLKQLNKDKKLSTQEHTFLYKTYNLINHKSKNMINPKQVEEFILESMSFQEV